MSHQIRKVDYFYTTVEDEPGAAYSLLSQLAGLGVNLVSFAAIPVGPVRTQLTLFPEDSRQMIEAAGKAGMPLDGPHPAILVRGDDELGALAGVHEQLGKADVNVFASTGVADGRGSYGYIIYVRPEKIGQAVAVLDI